ncbi:hypothetical protein JTB14_020567 [Gonioctena quinquepunctata]|nr:hypothetical protein JTB14_020567 [Gonioctena quinquepunctata]
MTNMTEETLQKFSIAREVWLELHRLYDGNAEDKTYDLFTDSSCKCNLPEILLICKILGTLPDEYFSFRSSWMLMAKAGTKIEAEKGFYLQLLQGTLYEVDRRTNSSGDTMELFSLDWK